MHSTRSFVGPLAASLSLALTAAIGMRLPAQVDWTPHGAGPPSRIGGAMADDPARDVVLLYGGQGPNAPGPGPLPALGDTWTWNGGSWTRRQVVSPAARYGHAMAYDAGRDVTVMFGGRDTSFFGDTYQWTGNVWTLVPLSPVGPYPPARADHAMAYYPIRDRVIMFGGRGASVFSDVWEFDGSRWFLRGSGPAPARRDHGMAYDGEGRRLLMFGGLDAGGRLLGDTWAWDTNGWTRLSPANSPSARHSHTMAYDSSRRRLVLFGGVGSGGIQRDDTWEWFGGNWVERSPQNRPPARGVHAMAYDSARRRLVVHGGGIWTGSVLRFANDTWSYGPTIPGQVRAFGAGCAGSNGVPVLTAASLPWIGEPYVLIAQNLPLPSASGFLVSGWSNTTWMGLPLPMELTQFGWSGCSAYVSADVARYFVGVNGIAVIQRSPLNPVLLGATYYEQLLVLDPFTARGVSVSNALAHTVGAK